MKKERPGCRGAAAFPKWSLERLLKFLNSSVFEPLERASWRVISNKLLVLVFLNTGRRCNEIGAMSGYSWEKGKVIFKWFPDFKANLKSYFGDWISDPPKNLLLFSYKISIFVRSGRSNCISKNTLPFRTIRITCGT